MNLCNHSGQGLPLRSVQVVVCVAEGAAGRPALFDPEEGGTVSWQLISVVPKRKPRRARTKAGQIPHFTIAPLGAR